MFFLAISLNLSLRKKARQIKKKCDGSDIGQGRLQCLLELGWLCAFSLHVSTDWAGTRFKL